MEVQSGKVQKQHHYEHHIPAWAESEGLFPSPDELDVELFDPDDDPEGGDRPQRHGIGPATVVMALATAGFRGAINPLCLQHLVELARHRGVREMVEQVHADTGLTYIPNARWWFCPATLVGPKGAGR